MLSPKYLKTIMPGIITRVAINYPIAYINSISFNVKNKIVAACFWNNKNIAPDQPDYFTMDQSGSSCYIFHSTVDIKNSDVEISGTDQTGCNFLVSLPFNNIIDYRIAS